MSVIMKNFIIKIFLFLFVVLMLPCIFTLYYTAKSENSAYEDLKEAQVIDDLDMDQKRMDIESYVKWSVAGTIPICFHLEALKAQIIITRTNTYKKLESLKKSYPDLVFPVSKIELPYIGETELENRIGSADMNKYLPVLEKAVKGTKGQITNTDNSIIFLPNANKMAELGESCNTIISYYISGAKYKIVKNN